jgi:hypothetical protein
MSQGVGTGKAELRARCGLAPVPARQMNGFGHFCSQRRVFRRNHLLTHETLFAPQRYCLETFGAQDAIKNKGRQMTLAFVLVVLSVAIFVGLDLILESFLRRGRLQR